jgi:ATP-dependent phosphofructokinase / diphosphate-dependent phosphofructokinase
LVGIRRIAILTGGGDCPGLNAVIRAVTKTAIFRGLEVVGVLEGFGGLVRGLSRALKEEDVSGILPRGGTILGTSNRDDPFNYCSRAGADHTVYEDCSDRAITNLERMRADALVVTGGDGSLKIALELCRKGVPIVGIPKTIDNDLMATDVTFGFDSAVQTATEAVDKLHTTAESHHRVMVLEVMGRNSGWIALMAGAAGGGDVILIPEIPFTFESVTEGIVTRRERGKRFSIIVVAEGARLPDGNTVSRTNASGVTVLGGIGELVAREVESLTGMEARVTVLGHLQRGGPPSPFDRVLGTRFGVKAVELVTEGEFGKMVSLRTPVIGAVPLEEAVARQRLVPPDGEIVRFARAVGTSFGDR